MIYTQQDIVKDERHNMRGGTGDVIIEHLLSGDALPPNTRLYAQITIPPGGSIGAHVHEGETEIFTFNHGVGKVLDDDARISVKPGYTLVTTSGHSHSVINDGDDDLVLMAIIILGE